jgi:pimeloyl-ACP methyl ester carboxylesterase
MARIESLLSARSFLSPQVVGDRIYFVSNLGGHYNLYAMDHGGSVPEPLLPPHVALQNPALMEGALYKVFPKIGKILVMVDNDGDERYQPMLIPLAGGFPEPAFGDHFAEYQIFCIDQDVDHNIAYFVAASQKESKFESYRGNLADATLTKLGESTWGNWPVGASSDHRRVALVDSYTGGDNILFLWEEGQDERKLLYGLPIEERPEGQEVPASGIGEVHFTESGKGLIVHCAIFEDTFSLGYLDPSEPQEVRRVAVTGTAHTGTGEMTHFTHLDGDRYALEYNIDGESWLYEGRFDKSALTLALDNVIAGQGKLSGGVIQAFSYDKEGDRFALSFSTASSPTQIYTVEGKARDKVTQHTRERVLGTREGDLSKGEDASFTSFDGLRVSARLYLPAEALGFEGPRPVVYYIHGGPQGQERPNFAWFSMPLIQFLTLNGFAVFVPNVRGSTGYGFSYAKRVDRDWGGQDRLDHVHAMTQVLPKDSRLDVSRSGVIGRSYGGYMTLTMASRHHELWSAAVDMFGPYNLITAIERAPETWKPLFYRGLGHPEKDRDFLLERSPYTYIEQVTCPLLVIQGANDPRVVERESRDVVEHLRDKGKQVDYLVFENEGHDVTKHENRVRCYNQITDFFKQHLRP